LLGVWLTAGGNAAFYTFTTYMQTFVKLSVGLTEDQTTLVIFGSLVFATILAARVGFKLFAFASFGISESCSGRPD
jgi:MHS family alpha-ketoglutarate permease-like MFS transporter